AAEPSMAARFVAGASLSHSLAVVRQRVELAPERPHTAIRRQGEGGAMKLIRTGFAAIAAVALALTAAAKADDYPSRPVRIVVPFEPGGINDVAARVIATHLSERLGKQFLTEYKSGAGGMVGTEYVSRQPADGYTIAVISVANAVHPALY